MPKITALTADTSPTSDDLAVIVNDPAGTPGTRKATLGNVITKAHGLTDGIVSASSGTLTTTLSLDTDGTLTANSDTKIASQKAVKTYADNVLGSANALVYKGTINCSANPNYPAANAGDLYVVSVAGKIGGASGIDVEVGDMAICNTDGTASGTEATVGTYWNIIQKNIVGAVTGPASSVNDDIAVFDGTSGKVVKDSSTKLSDLIAKSFIDAKGDLIVGSADNTPSILTSSGSNGNVLTVDTSTVTGLKWAAPSGGGQTTYDIVVAPSGGDYTTLTAALAAATAGQTIFVRSGTYTETQSSISDITTANLTIIGENRATTILQFAASKGLSLRGAKTCVFNIRLEFANATDSTFALTGNYSLLDNCEVVTAMATGTNGYGIGIGGVGTVVRNCLIEKSGVADVPQVIVFNNDEGIVEGCYILISGYPSTSNQGVVYASGDRIRIANNYFYCSNTAQSSESYRLLSCNNGKAIISNNKFVMSANTSTRFTAIYSPKNFAVISGNTFEYAANAIDVTTDDYIQITGNVARNCDQFVYSNGDYVNISGNTVISGYYGIRVTGGVKVTVNSNNINAEYPIIFQAGGEQACSIVGNNINGQSISSDKDGIYCAGSYVLIANNSIYFTRHGIRNTGTGCHIVGNVIARSGLNPDYAIYNTGEATTITTNRIGGYSGKAVYNSAQDCTIAYNFFPDSNDVVNNTVTTSVYDNTYISDTFSGDKFAGDLINEHKVVYMKNTSGGQLVHGDVVVLKSVAGCNEVTTTTTLGDDKVFGMAVGTVSDASVGRFLIRGKTENLKVNGTTDIAIGDFLTTHTDAKIACKATAGDTVFAIALEAYTVDDSNGVIDALLIPPRLI